jgi:hypothetical protein
VNRNIESIYYAKNVNIKEFTCEKVDVCTHMASINVQKNWYYLVFFVFTY